MIAKCRQDVLGLVGRAVIDDDDLDVLVILPERARDRLADEVRPVISWNDDGDARSVAGGAPSAAAAALRSLTFQTPRHLSAQSPSPSSQRSLISRRGGGKENGGRWRLSVLHSPVGISTFLSRLVNVVATRYLAPESKMFWRADRISLSERCTKRSRLNTRSALGSGSLTTSSKPNARPGREYFL